MKGPACGPVDQNPCLVEDQAQGRTWSGPTHPAVFIGCCLSSGAACKWQQGLRSTALHTYVLTVRQDKGLILKLIFYVLDSSEADSTNLERIPVPRVAFSFTPLLAQLVAAVQLQAAPPPTRAPPHPRRGQGDTRAGGRASGSAKRIEQLLDVLVFAGDGVGTRADRHEVEGEQLRALVDV